MSKVRIWDGAEPWLFTRYADVRALLADPRVSSDSTRDGYPAQSPGIKAHPSRAKSFITMDNPTDAAARGSAERDQVQARHDRLPVHELPVTW